MTSVAFAPSAEAARATRESLDDTLRGDARGVGVDSPPGAGKSTRVVRAALERAAAGRPREVGGRGSAPVEDLLVQLAEKDG
ncbi:helicase, partial [Streptomyces lavendulocolor]